MRFFVSILAVLALGAGGYYVWSKVPRGTNDPDADRPKTAIAEARSIQFAINAAGDIGPADQVSVRPEVNGRIAELPVDIGDSVKSGELLCRLDDADLQIEQAQRNFDRAKKLYDDNLVSKEVFDDARTEFELAKNSLERTDKALKL